MVLAGAAAWLDVVAVVAMRKNGVSEAEPTMPIGALALAVVVAAIVDIILEDIKRA